MNLSQPQMMPFMHHQLGAGLTFLPQTGIPSSIRSDPHASKHSQPKLKTYKPQKKSDPIVVEDDEEVKECLVKKLKKDSQPEETIILDTISLATENSNSQPIKVSSETNVLQRRSQANDQALETSAVLEPKQALQVEPVNEKKDISKAGQTSEVIDIEAEGSTWADTSTKSPSKQISPMNMESAEIERRKLFGYPPDYGMHSQLMLNQMLYQQLQYQQYQHCLMSSFYSPLIGNPLHPLSVGDFYTIQQLQQSGTINEKQYLDMAGYIQESLDKNAKKAMVNQAAMSGYNNLMTNVLGLNPLYGNQIAQSIKKSEEVTEKKTERSHRNRRSKQRKSNLDEEQKEITDNPGQALKSENEVLGKNGKKSNKVQRKQQEKNQKANAAREEEAALKSPLSNQTPKPVIKKGNITYIPTAEENLQEDNTPYIIKIHFDDKKKDNIEETRVGYKYHAVLPKYCLNDKTVKSRRTLKTVWAPESKKEDDLQEFFEGLDKQMGKPITNQERALLFLRKWKLDGPKLFEHIKKNRVYYENQFDINSHQLRKRD